jgi:hypothetical protein
MPGEVSKAAFAFRYAPQGAQGQAVELSDTGPPFWLKAVLADGGIGLWHLLSAVRRRGGAKLDHDEEKQDYQIMERRYGSFQRSLRLPDTVDESKIDARFDNGVLKVTIPKRPEAAGEQRKIEIKKS